MYYMLVRHEEVLRMISRVSILFKRKYRHEEYLLVISRVTLVLKIIYMQSEFNQKKVIMRAKVVCMHEGFLIKMRRLI